MADSNTPGCNVPSWCYGCNNGCNTTCTQCQGCNTCQYCDEGCQIDCNTIQTFCVKNYQLLASFFGNFSFSYPPEINNIMGPGYFDKSVWDELSAWISKRTNLIGSGSSYSGTIRGAKYTYTKGGGEDPVLVGGSSVDSSLVADVAPFKASEFNRLANILNYTNVEPGQLMKSEYFKGLESSTLNLAISSSACPMCVTACDNDCVSCEKCDAACDSDCDSCQDCNQGCNGTCNMCMGTCESCNSCNDP